MSERWTVGELAEVAGVTVRTLHHYEEIGLLLPLERSDAGYRIYGPDEAARLQRIRIYRALGFPLEGIRELLDDPTVSREQALRRQLDDLRSHHAETGRLIRTIERTLESIAEEEPMSAAEMFEGFEELTDAPDEIRAHHRAHAAETHERWGETDAWRESTKRTRSYSKEQWVRIRAESEALEARMAELLDEGERPDDERAMAGAEAMRMHIDRWYYPCSPAMHVGLADMYEADGRFREHYEARTEGLASFVAGAIRANAVAEGGGPTGG